MKSSHVCFGLLFLCGVACATGTKADLDGITPLVEPAQTTEPTEPPPESVTMPPPSPDEPVSGDASAPDSGGDRNEPPGSPASDAGASKPDGGSCATVAPSKVCGLAPQCGCKAGETCEITDKKTGAVSCVSAGSAALGAACTATSQCGTGLTCMFGACRSYCPTAKAACAAGGLCNQGYDPSGSPAPNAKVCTLPCDVRDPGKACGKNNCIWDKSLGASDCDSAGTRGLRQACAEYSDCAQGLQCAPHPVLGMLCQRWCRIGHDAECEVFETCKDVYGAGGPAVGADKLGLCQ